MHSILGSFILGRVFFSFWIKDCVLAYVAVQIRQVLLGVLQIQESLSLVCDGRERKNVLSSRAEPPVAVMRDSHVFIIE